MRSFIVRLFAPANSPQQLLRYIVDETLAGRSELLKERLIGVNASSGRRPDYDTNEDPIVRARAAEVRKRLAQFYVGKEAVQPSASKSSPGSYLSFRLASMRLVQLQHQSTRPRNNQEWRRQDWYLFPRRFTSSGRNPHTISNVSGD